jgi:PBP1b-binding outer membrane lipoprotein LpoB
MKTIALSILLLCLCLFWSGCSSPVRTVEPSDPTVQTFDINQADINDAARNMVNSMLTSPALAEATSGP